MEEQPKSYALKKPERFLTTKILSEIEDYIDNTLFIFYFLTTITTLYLPDTLLLHHFKNGGGNEDEERYLHKKITLG